jgi:cell division septation protein DedD
MDFLKKRLLGAAFVLSLTIIFVPEIFDGSGIQQPIAYQETLTQQLAAAPQANNIPTIRPVQYTNVRAWTVRIGAFSDSDSARNLEQKLQDHGYSVYVQVLPDSKLYGVFVGPELVAQNAEVVLKQLHEQLELDGVVIPYDPILYVQNS